MFAFSKKYDIMNAKDKQVTPKATFVYPAPLANEYPAKQDGKRVSANSLALIRELMI